MSGRALCLCHVWIEYNRIIWVVRMACHLDDAAKSVRNNYRYLVRLCAVRWTFQGISTNLLCMMMLERSASASASADYTIIVCLVALVLRGCLASLTTPNVFVCLNHIQAHIRATLPRLTILDQSKSVAFRPLVRRFSFFTRDRLEQTNNGTSVIAWRGQCLFRFSSWAHIELEA